MKKLISIFFVLFLVGCGSDLREPINLPQANKKLVGNVHGYDTYGIREFEYDGCQYVAFGDGHNFGVTHKGNCKYCEQRRKLVEVK